MPMTTRLVFALLAAALGCADVKAQQRPPQQGVPLFTVDGVTVYTFRSGDGWQCFLAVGEMSGYANGKNVALTCRS